MGSIPLPALAVQPPASPLETYGKLMSLRSLLGQQQLQQSQLATQELERQGQQNQLKLQQVQLNDIDAFHKAYSDSGGDLDKMFDLAPKYGASPNAMINLRTSILGLKQKMVSLDTDTLKDQQQKNLMLSGKLQSVIGAPPERQADLWTKAISDATSQGWLTPQVAQQLGGWPGADKAQQMLNGLMTQKDLFDQALQTKEQAAKVPGEQAQSVQDQLKTIGQMLGGAANQRQWDARMAALQNSKVDPELLALLPKQFSPDASSTAQQLGVAPDKLLSSGMLEKKYIDTLTKMYSRQPVTMQDRAFVGAFEKYKTLAAMYNTQVMVAAMSGRLGGGGGPMPAQPPTGGAAPGAIPAPAVAPSRTYRFGNPQLIGQAFIDSIGDPGLKAQVRQIVAGQTPFNVSGFASRSPAMLQLQHMVYSADPGWTAERNKVFSEYMTGRQSTTIDAINTALGHAGILNQAVDALNNGNVQVLNRVANAAGVEIGQTPVATFKTIANRLVPELIRAYNGSNAEGEQMIAAKDLSPNMSPAQLHANLQVTIQLLRSKISSQENRWERVFSGKPPFTFEDYFLSGPAKQALTQAGGSAGGGMVLMQAPNGQTRQVPADQVQHYKNLGARVVQQQ